MLLWLKIWSQLISMDLYHLYKKTTNKRKMQLRQIRRMMKKVNAVVSKFIWLTRRLIYSHNHRLSKYIFQLSVNVVLLFFKFSRNRRIKGCFYCCSFDQLHKRCLACSGGVDSPWLISLHKCGGGWGWLEGRLSWDTWDSAHLPSSQKLSKSRGRRNWSSWSRAQLPILPSSVTS